MKTRNTIQKHLPNVSKWTCEEKGQTPEYKESMEYWGLGESAITEAAIG